LQQALTITLHTALGVCHTIQRGLSTVAADRAHLVLLCSGANTEQKVEGQT